MLVAAFKKEHFKQTGKKFHPRTFSVTKMPTEKKALSKRGIRFVESNSQAVHILLTCFGLFFIFVRLKKKKRKRKNHYSDWAIYQSEHKYENLFYSFIWLKKGKKTPNALLRLSHLSTRTHRIRETCTIR